MHQLLTASRIKAAIQVAKSAGHDQWLSDDSGARGKGRLVIRVTPAGSHRFYFRVPRSPGSSTKVVPIGVYCRIKRDGHFTLAQARQRADTLSANFDASAKEATATTSTVATAEDLANHSAVAQSSSKNQPSLEPSTPGISLLELCRQYAQKLEDDGKISAPEMKSLVERHIAPSKLAQQSAREIKSLIFTELLRNVVAISSGRTAGKLRSLLHAAYAQAMQSKLDPSAVQYLVDFGVEINPISSIGTLAQYNKPRNRYLQESEFREVWRRLQLTEDSAISLRATRLCIVLGGQRAQQMVSVTLENVDLEAKTILLLDPKGRRKIPRQHLIPLCPMAEGEVRWLIAFARSVNSKFLFPGSRSGIPCNAGSISKEVLQIRRDMETKGLCSSHFAFIDFRRTIETTLAAMGVSEDYRAQLQSHGLGGIQNRHYNRHTYMKEKREVLTLWEQHLTSLSQLKSS